MVEGSKDAVVAAQGSCRDGVTRLRSRRSSRQPGPRQSGFAGAHEVLRAAGHVHVQVEKVSKELGQGLTRPLSKQACKGVQERAEQLVALPSAHQPQGHRSEPPVQRVGCRQLPRRSPGVGRRLSNLPASPGVHPGIKNTAAASSSSSLHETAKGPLAMLLLPAPTEESRTLPRTRPPPQSQREFLTLPPGASQAQPSASTSVLPASSSLLQDMLAGRGFLSPPGCYRRQG